MTLSSRVRRLTPDQINLDLDSLNGLKEISNYSSGIRADISIETLDQLYATLQDKQRDETAKLAQAKIAADAARLAETEFHNAVIAMKDFVKGVYGSDSDQATLVGLKRKSERKRPSRAANQDKP